MLNSISDLESGFLLVQTEMETDLANPTYKSILNSRTLNSFRKQFALGNRCKITFLSVEAGFRCLTAYSQSASSVPRRNRKAYIAEYQAKWFPLIQGIADDYSALVAQLEEFEDKSFPEIVNREPLEKTGLFLLGKGDLIYEHNCQIWSAVVQKDNPKNSFESEYAGGISLGCSALLGQVDELEVDPESHWQEPFGPYGKIFMQGYCQAIRNHRSGASLNSLFTVRQFNLLILLMKQLEVSAHRES